MNGERSRFTSSNSELLVGRVMVAEATEVPAGYEAVMPDTVDSTREAMRQPALMEPVEDGGKLAQWGLVLARSLVEPNAGSLLLWVIDLNRERWVVRKGTTIGTVEADFMVLPRENHERKVYGDLPSHPQDLYDQSKVCRQCCQSDEDMTMDVVEKSKVVSEESRR